MAKYRINVPKPRRGMGSGVLAIKVKGEATREVPVPDTAQTVEFEVPDLTRWVMDRPELDGPTFDLELSYTNKGRLTRFVRPVPERVE